jgi:hypothetical protein
MTRSERLAKEGKADTRYGVVKIISRDEMTRTDCNYMYTDFNAYYNGKECEIDVYITYSGEELGVIN